MRLAGHSKYDTTLHYYLAVKDDLVDKPRRAVRPRVSREKTVFDPFNCTLDWIRS